MGQAIFSTKIGFSELEVEDSFQELPSWEVTHFAWMIAWGMEETHEEDVPQQIIDSMP